MLSSFSPQQVKKIRKIIHNPEVLVEASQAIQQQVVETQREREQRTKKAIKQHAQKLFNDLVSPVTGNSKGNAATLVEFFDYQCGGHCKVMNQFIQNLVEKNKDLRVVFKELPIFDYQSQLATKTSLSAEKQGKYYVFHNAALLSTNDSLTNNSVFKIAKKIGLNVDQLKKNMNDPVIQKQLHDDNFQLAQSLQLVVTPTFFISSKASTNFRFVPGGATSQQNLQSAISRQVTK